MNDMGKWCIFAADNDIVPDYEIPFSCLFFLFSRFRFMPVVQGGDYCRAAHARGGRLHDVEQSR